MVIVTVSRLVEDPSLAVNVMSRFWSICSSRSAKMQKTPDSGRKNALSGNPSAVSVTGSPSGSVADTAISRSLPKTTD